MCAPLCPVTAESLPVARVVVDPSARWTDLPIFEIEKPRLSSFWLIKKLSVCLTFSAAEKQTLPEENFLQNHCGIILSFSSMSMTPFTSFCVCVCAWMFSVNSPYVSNVLQPFLKYKKQTSNHSTIISVKCRSFSLTFYLLGKLCFNVIFAPSIYWLKTTKTNVACIQVVADDSSAWEKKMPRARKQ